MNKNKIIISEVSSFNKVCWHAIGRFLTQLTDSEIIFSEDDFKKMIESDASHLFLIKYEDNIAGMLSCGIYRTPTGEKAWIEDVVIDEVYRGKGLAKILLNHALNFLNQKEVGSVMLTSKPERLVANKLYKAVGFEIKKTNVYKKLLK